MNTNLITNPHDLAAAGLCHYSGDMSPLDESGFWYESNNWVEHGYASAVRVTVMCDGPDKGKHLIVEKLLVKKPKDMTNAINSCGPGNFNEFSEDERVNIEIEACLNYGHYEQDCSNWSEPQSIGFIIPDEGQPIEDFQVYCDIHESAQTTQMGTDEEVWKTLAVWVGQDLN